MALICPRCETTDSANFFISKGQRSSGLVGGVAGPSVVNSFSADSYMCKICGVPLVNQKDLIADKRTLLHAQDPQEKARFDKEKKEAEKWENMSEGDRHNVIVGAMMIGIPIAALIAYGILNWLTDY